MCRIGLPVITNLTICGRYYKTPPDTAHITIHRFNADSYKMKLEIITFKFDDKLLRMFLKMSDHLYKGSSKYIKTFYDEDFDLLSSGNSLFTRVDHIKIMVMADSKVVARCIAAMNPDITMESEICGQIGFFESVENYEYCSALIQEAENWLKNKGLKTIIAPLNFSTWYRYRFKTDNFDNDTYMFEPYNKPYYPTYFEKLGYQTLKKYYTKNIDDISTITKRCKAEYEKLLKEDITIREIDKNRFNEEIDALYSLCIKTFHDNYLYSGISGEEFKKIYSSSKSLLNPGYFAIAEKNKQMVGFLFCIPDYKDGLLAMNGKKTIYSKIKFLCKKPKANIFLAKSFSVLPEYREMGVGSALIYFCHNNALKDGFKKGKHCLYIEDSLSDLFSRDYKNLMTYQMYKKKL